MIAQAHNRFVFSVVVVEFAVNGNQVLKWVLESLVLNKPFEIIMI